MEESTIEGKMEEEMEELDPDREIDLTEFELTHEQIDDLIGGLQDLKEHKQNLQFTIDESNDLLIHHEDESEGEERDEGEDENPDDNEKFVLGDTGVQNG